jgi:HK97 gp10 family phage protein
MERKVLEPYIAALAERAEELMRERAPRRTGRLTSSIHREAGRLEATVGPRAPYAIYVEYGTRPHVIRPVHARALRFEAGGHIVFAAWVQHPGTRPQSFIRQTAETVRGEAGRVFERVWREVAR